MSTALQIEEFLEQDLKKDLLRFSTAGSIDDGKSTLIGRLLYDSKGVYEDQLASVRKASKDKSSDEKIDLALLTDGLQSEREQGITIDVAYRYFATPKRKFIIADTPGHEQYTRNMATGASTANLSIVLIDALNGMLPQTRRHAFITSLLGVPHMVVAVNKMDLVNYDQAVFEKIKADFEAFADKLRIPDLRFIPISALKGDNVVERSKRMPWFRGESLMEVLEGIYIGSDYNKVDFRFAVQLALRPDRTFRGYAGQVLSGTVRKGDPIMALPSGRTSKVKSIVTFDGDLDEAFPPMSVTLTLEDEIDIGRGDMLVHPQNVPRIERNFEAMVVWMSEQPMDLNKSYYLKHTSHMVRTRIDEVQYRMDVNSLTKTPSAPLALNEIGRVVFGATQPLYLDGYDKNRSTGSFIIIDPISNNTAGVGMVIEREAAEHLAARMTQAQATPDLQHRDSPITPAERQERLGQKAATIWLTGLVGSRKTEIAYALEKRLFELGATALVLDGENVRMGISRDVDFSPEGTSENLRRAAEIARLVNDGGLISICAFVSPTRFMRAQAAQIVSPERFLEMHVSAPVEWCEANDTSGLYLKARKGEYKNFAGVDLNYEEPDKPVLTLPTHELSVKDAVNRILTLLRQRGIFPAK